MHDGLTIRRRMILEVVSASAVPLSAAQVLKKTQGINRATVYRALQYLERSRRLTGFTIPCAAEGVVRYYAKSEPHSHYLHCESCHSFIPFFECAVPKALPAIERRYRFRVRSHILTFFGVCDSCRRTAEDGVGGRGKIRRSPRRPHNARRKTIGEIKEE